MTHFCGIAFSDIRYGFAASFYEVDENVEQQAETYEVIWTAPQDSNEPVSYPSLAEKEVKPVDTSSPSNDLVKRIKGCAMLLLGGLGSGVNYAFNTG